MPFPLPSLSLLFLLLHLASSASSASPAQDADASLADAIPVPPPPIILVGLDPRYTNTTKWPTAEALEPWLAGSKDAESADTSAGAARMCRRSHLCAGSECVVGPCLTEIGGRDRFCWSCDKVATKPYQRTIKAGSPGTVPATAPAPVADTSATKGTAREEPALAFSKLQKKEED